ncbi:MAG: GAF domain-containing protein [Phaeodactylibacter sp.]|nr:GAF domain-containing protein [Phaeodactylibacter sp.]MCB9288803.1 GAF domain-containing protein [Lewinellaceae bacterium]
MEKAFHEPFWIFDVQGNLLWGAVPPPQGLEPVYILIEGEKAGYIVGCKANELAPAFINLIVQYEQDKRNILAETLDRYKEITLLYNLGEKLIANFDIQSVAGLIVSETLANLSGDSASLMLFNKNTGKLEVMAARIKSGRQETHIPLAPGEGIGGHVFQSGQPEIVNAVRFDKRFIPGNNPIESIMCVPLKVKEKTIGVANLASSVPHQYSSAELKLFYAITSQAAYALENTQLYVQKVREDRIRSNLQRYVPAQLVDAIIHSEDDSTFEPKRKNITTLFSDIRNFTEKCESLPPEQIVYYLNKYFSGMVDVIFKYNGTINKFVGDMIVALFGAPYGLENDARQAVQAAIEMQTRLASFNDGWIRENFLTGIGITKGEVVVGNIGSHHHMDYTAIGDSVNVAARLQSLAKGHQILVTESIYQVTRSDFTYRKFDQVIHLKGRHQPVQIFEVRY